MAFVGEYLNAARQNLHMRDALENRLQQKNQEQEILSVLCSDSTSVFKVDLLADRAETVKLSNGANASQFISLEDRPSICFSAAMKEYF